MPVKKKKIIFNFVKFLATKKVRQQFFPSSSLLDPVSMTGDRVRKKSGYGKNTTDPLHCFLL
jgi:hypothetical protein